MAEVLRYAAFTDVPDGGNPAGVVLDASGLSDEEMQAVAADVGYSETAFLVQSQGELGAPGAFDVRYFSPKAEVPFCGHATIASAVALHDHGVPGPLTFRTASGEVPVLVREVEGTPMATLTSVVPQVRELPIEQLDELLACFGWAMGDLDLGLPARLAYAGAWHPVLPLATHHLLHEMAYDFDRLLALMEARSWTTVQAVWREDPTVFHVRDPFPVGGVVEDPATGAAAAALGAYLVDVGAVRAPEVVTVHQGTEMGRPSLLKVELLPGDPRVHVSGTAVPITGG
jgi:PhzF family phenazine biosynthesis protein